MRDVPWWVFVLAGGAAFLYFKKRAILNAPGDAGRALSRGVFDFLNPDLSREAFNKPTQVPARRIEGKFPGNPPTYLCPPGYRYKFTQRGEHICLRTD